MVYFLIAVGLLVCTLQAVRAQRLLLSAIWLAGASALTALMMFLLGAPEVAVIELSVGAGLVTVLFVFAINIAGEESTGIAAVVPRPLAGLLVVGILLLLGWFNAGSLGARVGVEATPGFAEVVWGERRLDVYLQVLLIFAGVLAVLGLMAETDQVKAVVQDPIQLGLEAGAPGGQLEPGVETTFLEEPVLEGIEEKPL